MIPVAASATIARMNSLPARTCSFPPLEAARATIADSGATVAGTTWSTTKSQNKTSSAGDP
jgi:hypothetical protein